MKLQNLGFWDNSFSTTRRIFWRVFFKPQCHVLVEICRLRVFLNSHRSLGDVSGSYPTRRFFFMFRILHKKCRIFQPDSTFFEYIECKFSPEFYTIFVEFYTNHCSSCTTARRRRFFLQLVIYRIDFASKFIVFRRFWELETQLEVHSLVRPQQFYILFNILLNSTFFL